MLSSEKRSLIRFLVIYLASTFLLFSLAAWVFYASSKHHLIEKQRDRLKYEAKHMQSVLRSLHQSNSQRVVYPRIKGMDTAIYDLDRHYIFGSFPKGSEPALDKKIPEDMIVYIERVEPHYLGAAYLLVAKKIDFTPIRELERNIILFMLAAGLFFAVLGYFLGRLFVAPMRQAIEQMNRFIQDTTHELNTPISTILTNVEMIETFEKCSSADEELRRITIASQTLSRIYDDLTYLNLNHHYHRNVEKVDMGRLVEERLVYFRGMAEAKHLDVHSEIDENVMLTVDRNDALRLVDNLLSNAIKYNRPGGRLKVVLDSKKFEVTDTGSGIRKRDMAMILQRFKRADSSEGGFGIGLDIVNQVVKSYGYRLSFDSVPQKGTTVRIIW
ncbi:MAG: HAMP domain-containing histidine kinase [Sulfurovum sp.]|nr:HAMP domain-containing histidine kinase [Sulfurovum sp.]